MRTCVIGAGLSGLAAARTLRQAGGDVVLFEKRSDVGGRVATKQLGEYIFDVGATNLAPRGKELERVMLNELDTSELVRVESPIYIHESLRAMGGDARTNAMARYTYRPGNARLPKMLSEGLDIRLETDVAQLAKRDDGTFEVQGEVFDAVVLTPPAPESIKLLESVREWRPVTNVYYRACLSVMLAYEQELPDLPYHAILDPEQRHPLTWLSLESRKCPSRAPEGCSALVAQMSPQFSATHMGSQDPHIVELTADYIERLYGKQWAVPHQSAVVRWRYSQPESVASFEGVNRPGAKLVIAGDALLGSRTEHAYDCGVRAAQVLLDGASSSRGKEG